jgi:hypothetical protein
MVKLLKRTAIGFSSIFFLLLLIPLLARFLDEYKVPVWMVFGSIAFWLFALVWFEIKAASCVELTRSRLLKNLRFAPLAVFVSAIAVTLVFDQAMILHSQWKIYSYIHSNTPLEVEPELHLYNDHRGFCGNGYSARRSSLYFGVAAKEFNNTNPEVRARALQASIETYDWLNGMKDNVLKEMVNSACQDDDSTVRKIANRFLEERQTSCLVTMRNF